MNFYVALILDSTQRDRKRIDVPTRRRVKRTYGGFSSPFFCDVRFPNDELFILVAHAARQKLGFVDSGKTTDDWVRFAD